MAYKGEYALFFLLWLPVGSVIYSYLFWNPRGRSPAWVKQICLEMSAGCQPLLAIGCQCNIYEDHFFQVKQIGCWCIFISGSSLPWVKTRLFLFTRDWFIYVHLSFNEIHEGIFCILVNRFILTNYFIIVFDDWWRLSY